MRILVAHGAFGCETGCCAHWVTLVDDKGNDVERRCGGIMEHPEVSEDQLAWAKSLVAQAYGIDHVADLDWDGCMVVTDESCGF